MKLLEERIKADGLGIGTEILKVDSFLNHQIDASLMDEMGKEFARIFKDSGATKILTLESSGIAVAMPAALHMGNLPLVFAKKKQPCTMPEGAYLTNVHSFTKNADTPVIISKKFLAPEDRILIIDDFLASGSAAFGLLDLIRQAGAKAVGLGAAIEKEFQGGSRKLREAGVPVHSLAVILSISDNNIVFKEQK